ncbi:phosphopantothenoylcysteine decarboxylase / phosphopantothenate--cysteine ligase [Thiohalospira halophila DSM 15071]|uniref:Coenzyme A biosynthesis bifunctional protein CoaBC n=1 Tax=Thiohalospira halophila DSM 15071 TaxID=1123397 RepID=A0A1I1SL53_9GAMM|nr:phosphopantothenoylcysteine decarboxylase / phosphopantothenate--cysteine ligase [Thiohalospira halophila DSM 15071]
MLVGVGGGIAAYKVVEAVRGLRAAGAEVRVMMSEAATAFITPLTLQAVSGHPVRQQLLDPEAEAGMDHIELARWPEAILLAPAGADRLARLAVGRADDLIGAVCLATTAPLLAAPAMNHRMWAHPATQRNVEQLGADGVQLLGPASGDQACGENGPGRMVEPTELVAAVTEALGSRSLTGRCVMVTAGPTREPVDPVRYLGNRSSGKTGFAIAAAARRAGARVILVAGPVNLATPPGVERVDVQTAEEMRYAVHAWVGACDLFVGTAAVADYRPAEPAAGKVKRDGEGRTLSLVPNPDILAEVAARPKPPLTMGFAAETGDVEANARAKLASKGIDLVVANEVGEGKGFDTDDNTVTVLWEGGRRRLGPAPKTELARELVALAAARLDGTLQGG